MADDGIDVKEEGRKSIKKQQGDMRDTADNEDYARQMRTKRGYTKKSAKADFFSNFYDNPSKERTKRINRDDYVVSTMGDKSLKKKSAGKKKRAKRVAGK